MNQLTPTDLQLVVRRIPTDIRELMKSQPIFLGGGFIRETIAGGKVSDIDLFGPGLETLRAVANTLEHSRRKNTTSTRKFETKNAITLLSAPRMPVQFITRWLFTDPEALVASFDFTVCQAVVFWDRSQTLISGQGWSSRISEGFYPDLAARRLVYTSPVREEEAGGSMLRMRKFLSRGYNIQANNMAAVIARVISKVNQLESLDDAARTKVIAGLLYEVDPLFVVDGLEPLDEHEML